MKKIIASAFLLGSVATSAMAQTTTPAATPAAPATTSPATTTPTASTSTDGAKTKVELTALPDAVKKTLAESEYKEWQIVSAWLVKSTSEYYSLELKKDEKSTITFNVDKEGKIVKS